MSTQHTATPWYCHLEGSVRICNGDHDVGCSAIAEAEILGCPRAEAIANAAFIVLAVNSHEKLLEAAKAVLARWDTPSKDVRVPSPMWPQIWPEDIRQLRQAVGQEEGRTA